MSILRFIQFNSSLISHSHYALSILYSLSSYSILNSQLLNLFLKSCLSLSEQFELMHSFVEFVEFDDDGELSAEQSQLAALRSNIESIDLGGGGGDQGVTTSATANAVGMMMTSSPPRRATTTTRTNTNSPFDDQPIVESEYARSQCRLQVILSFSRSIFVVVVTNQIIEL